MMTGGIRAIEQNRAGRFGRFKGLLPTDQGTSQLTDEWKWKYGMDQHREKTNVLR